MYRPCSCYKVLESISTRMFSKITINTYVLHSWLAENEISRSRSEHRQFHERALHRCKRPYIPAQELTELPHMGSTLQRFTCGQPLWRYTPSIGEDACCLRSLQPCTFALFPAVHHENHVVKSAPLNICIHICIYVYLYVVCMSVCMVLM